MPSLDTLLELADVYGGARWKIFERPSAGSMAAVAAAMLPIE
jgi:hypothetical protein